MKMRCEKSHICVSYGCTHHGEHECGPRDGSLHDCAHPCLGSEHIGAVCEEVDVSEELSKELRLQRELKALAVYNNTAKELLRVINE